MKTIKTLSAVALTAATLGITVLTASEALAGKVQPVSQNTAQALCKSGGYPAGTTTCGFCDGNHCHSVDCNESGKCFNTTFAPPRTTPTGGNGKRGAGTGTVVATGSAGAKTGNNPPPRNAAGTNHPVIGSMKGH